MSDTAVSIPAVDEGNGGGRIPRRTARQRIFRILGILVILTPVAAILHPIVFQNSRIYLARRYDDTPNPVVTRSEGFRTYRTTDGRTQWGLMIPPAPLAEGAAPKQPRCYLVFNGNGATARDIATFFRGLSVETGIGFFICDFRGYGFNAGRPTEAGLAADALGAYDTLAAEGMFSGGAGVIGISLGGAVAIKVASERPTARLMTLATFTSMDDMAKRMVPWPLYLGCWNHWPSEERLRKMVSGPTEGRPGRIVLMHGHQDDFVPFAMGERLAAACGPAASFITIEGCMHGDILEKAGTEVQKAIEQP